MTKLKDLHKKMMKDPEYRKEYDALEEEFVTLSAKAKLFQDLGLPNPEHEALRADLVRTIYGIIGRRRLSEAKVAAMLGIKPSQAAALMRNRSGQFTLDQLTGFMAVLG
jgi:predicted XRE-type DNA-binding protein